VFQNKLLLARQFPAHTHDDLIDRNRALIDLAQAVVDKQRILRRIIAERSDRASARSMLLRDQSRVQAMRLMEIRAATENLCRKSRRASERSRSLVGRSLTLKDV